MSQNYDYYLEKHLKNVKKAYNYILKNLPEYDKNGEKRFEFGDWSINNHDKSKLSEEEYEAYDAYFNGDKTNKKVKNEFEKAWLHHIHNNPHHWQYYILREDDPKEIGEFEKVSGAENPQFSNILEDENDDFYAFCKVKLLEIPDNYILEMVCDWWSFSWDKGNLFEIFDWYEVHKNLIQMHPKSREKVEKMLGELKNVLQINASEDVIEKMQ